MSNIHRIKKLYTTVTKPGSFTSSESFKNHNKQFRRNEIQKALSQLESHSIHKKIKRKFIRSKTFVPSIDDTWQIDLIDVSKLKNKKYQQYYNFIFTCIDCFSKKAWAVPIPNKFATSTTKALDKIIKSSKRKPKRIYSDEGKEFLGSFRNYLEENKIQQLFTKSIHKASIVERFNRTFKEKLYRIFTEKKSTKYINIIDDVLKSYNNSYHRSIKSTPNSVNSKNSKIIFKNLYGDYFSLKNQLRIKYKLGSYVRKSVAKKFFDKGYTPNWSDEIYLIKKIIPKIPVRYIIKSTGNNKTLDQQFYEQELQHISNENLPENLTKGGNTNEYQIANSKSEQTEQEKIQTRSKNKT